METNTKRLTLLLRGIDLTLLLIIASIIITFFYMNMYSRKFSDFANQLPGSDSFDNLKLNFKWITFKALLPKIVSRLLYGAVLFYLRKIVKSILNGGVFQSNQAIMIRKIAYYFLIFACLLLFFNLMLMTVAIVKGNMRYFTSSLLGFIGIFEQYVLPGLIGLGIAEVFISGMKIKEEQDLTI
ncbi:DUF2975 domain-containing protein [Pedobacter planticolens]|nr:DUF2975 domain-containing protein [Pedobacter planticolens]